MIWTLLLSLIQVQLTLLDPVPSCRSVQVRARLIQDQLDQGGARGRDVLSAGCVLGLQAHSGGPAALQPK